MTWFRRCVVVPLSLATGLGLAACDSSPSVVPTTTSTARSNQVAYLCHVIPRVDRLIITRHAPGNQFHFTFPVVVTVTNAAAAREVATSACALPDVPTGVRHCPAGFAVSYHLIFWVQGQKGPGADLIVVNPTGCQSVTGLGPARTTSFGAGFYQLLGTAMGLKNASYRTFVGIRYALPV